MNLGRSVEHYEETLSHLVGDNSQSDSYISGNSNVKNEYDPEEYILDEDMDELNEDVSVSEESEPIVKPKKEVRHKTKCQICKEVFKNKSKLQIHEKETGHIVLWDCDMCDKKFKTKSIAQMHKARLHSTVMPFKCGKCEKRFKDQGSCRRHEANDSVHIRLESMKLNPNLICNICGKEFDRNRRLRSFSFFFPFPLFFFSLFFFSLVPFPMFSLSLIPLFFFFLYLFFLSSFFLSLLFLSLYPLSSFFLSLFSLPLDSLSSFLLSLVPLSLFLLSFSRLSFSRLPM